MVDGSVKRGELHGVGVGSASKRVRHKKDNGGVSLC